MLNLIQAFFRVAVVWSSNAIEGFAYTEMETKILLEDGLTAGGKPLRDALAVIGHAKAYDHMFALLRRRDLTEADALIFHALLNGSLDNESHPGVYRQTPVFVTGSEYKFPDPDKIPGLMEKFFQEIAADRHRHHPVAFAAHIHKELVTIHPFADGNGRVARLAMNALLIQDGFLPTIIPPVSRREYYQALRIAQTQKNEQPFIKFICLRELETQKETLRHLESGRKPE
jgi:Fic family protein